MPGERSSPSCVGHVMPSGGAIATEPGVAYGHGGRVCHGWNDDCDQRHTRQGTDLRPARNTDLVSLVQSQSRRKTPNWPVS
jgi:hypothetical protein